MFEELEYGIRKPTDKEVENALYEDVDDIWADRRRLILDLASPNQLAKIKRFRASQDGWTEMFDQSQDGPQEFLNEDLKDD